MFDFDGIEKGARHHPRVAPGAGLHFDDGPMPLSAPPAEPGISFTKGALRLGKDSMELRITALPVPQAVMRRGRGSCWEPFIPDASLDRHLAFR